jgi:NDP-sugar pyrophosphorylase family protein
MSGKNPLDALRPEAFFDLRGFEHTALFEGVEFVWEVLGRIGGYLDRVLKPEILGTVMEGARVEGTVYLGEGAVIETGAYVKGPALIGPGCQVRHGAYIRGKLLAGRDCVIGHSTEVKNALFLDNAKAPHFAYVGDSILGRAVNLGAGTRLANLRIDNRSVVVRLRTDEGIRRIETGRRKFGAILGDGVQTGCNSVLSPGSLLGKGAMVYPNTSVYGFHGPGTIIRGIDTRERRG